MASIVVIDDSDVILKVLVRQLQVAGHEALGISDPAKAIAPILRRQPQLVLLDVNVPELDGPRFCEMVRGSTIVLLHSAQSDSQLLEVARQWGAQGYVGKAWPVERKLAEVQRLLAG